VSKRGAKSHGGQGSLVDPWIGYLIFLGIGLGTWQVSRPWRQTVLWLFLLVWFLLYCRVRPVKANFTWMNVGWGALIGAVIGLPLLAVAWKYLYSFAVQLFATNDARLLFYELVLFLAPVEELYFRGFVQREKGMAVSVALYTAAALIYFVPGLHIPALAVAIGAIAYGLLGFVYSYTYARHGLSAAIAGHLVFNLAAMVLPFLAQYVSKLT
jgi:membrane protease YdiL (CAAX protease family)